MQTVLLLVKIKVNKSLFLHQKRIQKTRQNNFNLLYLYIFICKPTVIRLYLDILSEHFFEIIEVSKKEKEVKELYTSTGDQMILAKVVFRTNKELSEFVKM